jgi:hypothetical protein
VEAPGGGETIKKRKNYKKEKNVSDFRHILSSFTIDEHSKFVS